MIKRKLNKFLLFRMILVLLTVVVCYFPMLFLPFKWNFPWLYRIAIRYFLWANRMKVVDMSEYRYESACPAVIAATHKSFADPLILARHLRKPFAFSMSSHVLDIIPPFKIIALKMGFISINRSSYPKMVKSMNGIKSRLDRGISVVFFPEGYYTEDKPVGELKKGISLVAEIAGDYNIIPAAIYNVSQSYIYDRKIDKKTAYIKYGAPIKYSDYSSPDQFVSDLRSKIESLYLEMHNKLTGKDNEF